MVSIYRASTSLFTVAKQLTPEKGEMTSGNLHQLPELSYPKN